MSRHSFPVLSQQFLVDDKYQFVRELGQGAYGVVCAARNTITGEGVAIKKVTNVFNKTILTKRALREVKLLQHFRGHKNITCLYDMDIINPNDFNEIYLYEELMEADLHAIIRSGQPLTDAHYQSFTYQILCGLKYIHSANVLHRDLKPGNLLVNADCELKICDFGLARGFSEDPGANAGFMTEYVATRWYRAPEIMLSFQSYTKAIDLWSVGCILAELLGGRPIFKGRDYVDQLNQILQTLGTPSELTLSRIGKYIRNLPRMQKRPFAKIFPNANALAIDLLERLLTFDPAQRITVEKALDHPYLAVWHEPNDEPGCAETFDFSSFESVDDPQLMRRMIVEEVTNFRNSVRRHQVPHLNLATNKHNLSKIPDRDTILNSPTAVRGDVDALAAHYVQPGLHKGIGMSEDLERELSGRMEM
ncbi:16583_t:CDS:10 [Dentiscutata erythropus]|uniref:Mitogen-activated protein kinase n=1 Tax=Dentiscutata erythropus TaxID=1348616 RepID=A0A9N9CMP8_9GLOM|nr:16583_t:CDS:10 [Dentiscutata erythropus]